MTENKKSTITESDYNEFLNITLKQAFDEHKQILVDLDNIQGTACKNYLWMNALIVTGLCSILSIADLNIHNLDGLRPIFGAGLCVAILWSIYNFLKSAHAYRGASMKSVTDFYLQKVNLAYWGSRTEAKVEWIVELDNILQRARGESMEAMDAIHQLNHSTMAAACLGTFSTVLFFLDNFMR